MSLDCRTRSSECISAGDKSNKNSNFRTFENIAFGLRMLYPSDWSVTEVKSTLSPNASTSAVAFFRAERKPFRRVQGKCHSQHEGPKSRRFDALRLY